ncbi:MULTISPECIES: BON domain-containing protein [Burkholderia]|uniref:BON domain-containing protein n=1 Tax=Burkholderia sola TaxID=2843302 RepID=A0ABV2CEE0_9BURK|nr:BON domain-containing protein [Burkholderia sp. CpTa8-5]MBP0609485.1 BON domain-containing protein [Burkholderia sp. CpTa8-5]
MKIRKHVVRAALAGLCMAAATSAFAQDPISGSTARAAPTALAASQSSSAAGTRVTKKAQKKADRQLVKRVSQAIARARGLDSTRMSVSAKNGVVTLSGTIADNVQAGIAVDAAQSVSGVLAVKNQLRIGTQNW